ncbi:hypothetical protein Dimus_007214 [Dionaea muscipula]
MYVIVFTLPLILAALIIAIVAYLFGMARGKKTTNSKKPPAVPAPPPPPPHQTQTPAAGFLNSLSEIAREIEDHGGGGAGMELDPKIHPLPRDWEREIGKDNLICLFMKLNRGRIWREDIRG